MHNAHTELVKKCTLVLPELDRKEIDALVNKVRIHIAAEAEAHLGVYKNVIEGLFDAPYNGAGSFVYREIVGGCEKKGQYWLDGVKEKTETRVLINKAISSGLLKRSEKAFTAHAAKIQEKLVAMHQLAKLFAVTIDAKWLSKYAALAKKGHVVRLE